MGLRIDVYNRVFNSDGIVRNCGRQAYKMLIKESGIKHGNIETGYVDIKRYKNYTVG